MNTVNSKLGFTLVETIFVVSIFLLSVVTLTSLQKDIFVNNLFVQNSLMAESEARGTLKRAIAEIRAAAPANNGFYPIEAAGTSTLTFYSDSNRDGLRERVRYFIATTTLKRGLTKPTGEPATYLADNEIISTVVNDIVISTSTPLFSYYDSTYNGTTSPLAYPLNISKIRLIKMTILIEADPNRSPLPLFFSSQVMIRSLKDNL